MAQNEIQHLAASAVPGAGSFKLRFSLGGNQDTTELLYNVDASTLQSALEGLSNIGSGNVAVSGTDWTTGFDIEFQGALANTNVPQLQVINSVLGESAGTVDAVEVTDGVAQVNEKWDFSFGGGTSGGFAIQSPVSIQIINFPDISTLTDVSSMQAHFDANLGSGQAIITGGPNDWTVEWIGTRAATNLDDPVISGDTTDGTGATVTTDTQGQAGVYEVQTITIDADAGQWLPNVGRPENPCDWDCTAAELNTAIIPDGPAFTATGSDGGPFTATWNAYGSSSLYPVDAHTLVKDVVTITVSTTQGGEGTGNRRRRNIICGAA